MWLVDAVAMRRARGLADRAAGEREGDDDREDESRALARACVGREGLDEHASGSLCRRLVRERVSHALDPVRGEFLIP